MAMDIGAVTAFVWGLREREHINDFLEELCGARLTYNYHRIGGVSFDMPKGWRDKVLRWLDTWDAMMEEFDRLVTLNDVFIKRTGNVAVITGKEAKDWGLVGPNLRASGVDWDLRKADKYGAYPDFDFQVAVGEGRFGAVGDCWDRFYVRAEECRQSGKIVRQALEKIDEYPEDDIVGKLPKKLRPDAEAYGRIESARGDMGCYVIGKGGEEPYRVRFRTGSFTSMGIIGAKSPGLFIADLVALIASLDVVAPEIDR
jgi:NADH-quinone oxidoreductase subunit D